MSKYAIFVVMLMPVLALAQPNPLKCKITSQKYAESTRFFVTLNEAAETVTHIQENGLTFDAKATYEQGHVLWKKTHAILPGVEITNFYDLNRAALSLSSESKAEVAAGEEAGQSTLYLGLCEEALP